MSDANLSRVDAFLANFSNKQQQQPQPQRGNLIFALDATGSREQAWDSAAELQIQMFKEAAVLGGIDVQLVYYRGTQGFDAECKASNWVGNPMRLATLMSSCRAGKHKSAGCWTMRSGRPPSTRSTPWCSLGIVLKRSARMRSCWPRN